MKHTRSRKTGGRGKAAGQNISKGDAEMVLNAPTVESVPRIIRMLNKEVRLWRRVLAHSGSFSTAASGFVGVTAVTGSNAMSNSTDWTTVSELALEFRVLGIECEFFPILNAQTSYTTPAPPCYALCAYSSGLAPSTVDSILVGAQARIVSGHKPFKFSASAKGFMDGLSWTPCNATISSTNTYGIYLTDLASGIAGPVSTKVLLVTFKYLVELRSFL
jgi:hypothetical protein